MSDPKAAASRWLARLRRPRTVVLLALLEVALLGAVNGVDFPLSVPSLRRETGHAYLDMCAFCSSAAVQRELVGLGERGRLLQALLLSTIDVLIPVLSCVFGLAALSSLLDLWGPSRHRWVLALPLAAAMLDFAENASIAALLVQYPRPSPTLAGLEALLSGLKFVSYAAVLAALAALGLATLARRGVRATRRRRVPS